MTTSCTFLGQFLSPIVLDGIGKLVNNSAIRFQYGTLAVFILVIVAINTFMVIRSKQQVQSSKSAS